MKYKICYFLPGVKNASNRDVLAARGLDRVIDHPISREQSRGPDGTAGCLVAEKIDGLLPAFNPEWAWTRRYGSDAWIGVDLHDPPLPHELQRSAYVRGPAMTLPDGNEWIIPRLRTYVDTTDASTIPYVINLEQRQSLDYETGKLVNDGVIKKYRAVWDAGTAIADSMLEQIRGNNSAVFADDQIDNFAGMVMALNYRMELPEMSALQLLHSTTTNQIMQTAIHLEGLWAILGNLQRRKMADAIDHRNPSTEPSAVTNSDSGEPHRSTDNLITTAPR